MKVLVTGSAGKVGRAAVKALMQKGHEVRATDVVPPVFERPEPDDPEYIQADVSDAGGMFAEVRGVDAVFAASQFCY